MLSRNCRSCYHYEINYHPNREEEEEYFRQKMNSMSNYEELNIIGTGMLQSPRNSSARHAHTHARGQCCNTLQAAVVIVHRHAGKFRPSDSVFLIRLALRQCVVTEIIPEDLPIFFLDTHGPQVLMVQFTRREISRILAESLRWKSKCWFWVSIAQRMIVNSVKFVHFVCFPFSSPLFVNRADCKRK